MPTATAVAYRSHFFGSQDDRFHKCLVGSAIAGGVFLLVILLVPIRRHVITSIEQLPPRFAKLIVEKPVVERPMPPGDVVRKPEHEASPDPGGGGGGGGTPKTAETPKAGPAPAPVTKTPPAPAAGRVEGAPSPVARGEAGRSRAQAVVASRLATTTATLEQSLRGLSTSLKSTTSSAAVPPMPGTGRRVRGVRAGRSDQQIGSVRADLGSGGSADLGGSAVEGSWVSVGSLSAIGGGAGGSGSGYGGYGGGSGGGIGTGHGTGVGSGYGPGSGSGSGGGSGSGVGTGTGSGSGAGSAPGVYRSNASLLAVVRRYAAGIQYCYGNELKRDPTLRGKIVVAIVVAASGEVTEANIVQDTVGSRRLATCALSQIKEWRFPAIAEGVTAFQAPFVFTPPN